MNNQAIESQGREGDASHEVIQESPAKKSESESEIPNRLGKRARTAYFIFQAEKRAELREQVCYVSSDFHPSTL